MARTSWDKSTKYLYIFCEWKTEVSYFKKIRSIYRIPGLKIEPVDLGWWTKLMDHPEWIKKKIQNTLKRDNPKLGWIVPKVFIVFDLDIFTDKAKLDNTLIVLRDYNPVPSNMIFEYWILSHFQQYNLSNWKDYYLKELKTHLSWLPNMPDLKSHKMTDWDFEWLDRSKIEVAITNVRAVNVGHWNLKDRDPYSEVYKIIEFLKN